MPVLLLRMLSQPAGSLQQPLPLSQMQPSQLDSLWSAAFLRSSRPMLLARRS